MSTQLQRRAQQVVADLGLGKIEVEKIEILWSENGNGWCGEYDDFASADSALREMAETAPDDGATYHKTEYKVTFRDGESYQGRICLKRHDKDHEVIIQRSMGSFVDFHAGRARPERLTVEEYERTLQFYDSSPNSNRKGFGEFRDRYDF